MTDREKIYNIGAQGQQRNIRRVVRNQTQYDLRSPGIRDWFFLGTARIFGEDRIVKRFAFFNFWHIPRRDFDRATMEAMADYEKVEMKNTSPQARGRTQAQARRGGGSTTRPHPCIGQGTIDQDLRERTKSRGRTHNYATACKSKTGGNDRMNTLEQIEEKRIELVDFIAEVGVVPDGGLHVDVHIFDPTPELIAQASRHAKTTCAKEHCWITGPQNSGDITLHLNTRNAPQPSLAEYDAKECPIECDVM